MSDTAGPKSETKPRTSKTWLMRLLAGASGFLAATISLGYSLYERRQADVIPEVAASVPVAAGRWTVSVNGTVVGAQMPNGARIAPGKKAIVVAMTLENISAQSSNLYGSLIKLADLPDAPRPQYYLTRDRAILWDLQPRMPEAVTAVWEVPANVALPDVLRLQVEGEVFKPRDNLYSAPGWFPSGAVAQITLPLKDETSEVKP
ncbi:hypothetical protein J5277_12055 [Rhizobium sp. 16-449-1b]|uniref:hypothetical protein n=1 Tax=Rhizobium sp. 16-449-1b TaxID=2819989 RepID=UPI001AD9C6F2|nr:hypothetical protein [Rhizobium sp. 16-449-1b]MBO9194842.1 hypothetical protein [Rhizobium sp. 16-449-1b]